MKYWLSIWIVLMFCSSVYGQNHSSIKDIERGFVEVESLMRSFKNDSALVVMEELLSSLDEMGELDSPLGLQIQLREAEAIEKKDDKDELAIKKLLIVAEKGQEKQKGDVLTNAHLSLARLFEKIGRESSCYEHLQNAKVALDKYEVDSLYPRYCIRTSSYYRIFIGNRDSVIYYANEVLRTAPKYNFMEEHAVGHLLLGMSYSNKDNQKAIFHYKAAGRQWYSVEDFSGYGAVMGNIASLYLRDGNFKKAYIYNDSSLYAAVKASSLGNNEEWMFSRGYKTKAEIYKEWGEHDSAWHYLKQGYDIELKGVSERNNEKIIEIEAQYKDKKNTEIISKQKEELERGQRDRQNFILLSFIFLSLILSLAYLYYKLEVANRTTTEQSSLLKKTNEELSQSLEEQIILQGEVHHRVKNNLQVIISLLELQMDESDNPVVQDNFTAMSNRIYSMAAIHEILYQKEGAVHVNILDYVENLCMHFSNFSNPMDKPEFRLEMKEIEFNLVTCMPLGIIITELLTNSLKYARLSDKRLVISIELYKLSAGYRLIFKDNGQGYPEGTIKEREGGLGTYLINSMVRQLNGACRFTNESGAKFSLDFNEKSN